tara:strand:- start:53 stop:1000 length:948 start_codon:yes stop_codon:yes gene_type:complete
MTLTIIEKLNDFDFKTFHIGIILKPSLLERDDFIKSKFKIQGVENLKFDIAKQLGKKISRKTHSIRTYDDPDIFIDADFKDMSCKLHTKHLVVYGRYNKTIRNISQKQSSCRSCNGVGCHNCDFKGIISSKTIESSISNFFINKFECKQVKINWIGGEDQLSLVMGNGRPFFAKLMNPKKRNRLLRKTYDLKDVYLSELQKLSVQPKGFVRFKSEVAITVQTKKPISSTQLRELKTLVNTPILDSTDEKKNFAKHIYQIKYKKSGRHQFHLDIIVDGGIPIKSLIEKSDLTPNISDLIKNRCRCQQFDFKNILVC